MVFAAEHSLLASRGEDVETLEFQNASIPSPRGALDAARLAATAVWSRSAAARVAEAARQHHAHVVHFHNTFPLISPAAYWAARGAGAAVVQTLHNYRLLCPEAQFYRDGRPCEDCRHRAVAWPGIVHACYRHSRSQTAVVATMQSVHRALGTWKHAVDCYIALTEFARFKFVDDGIHPDRIMVKPNFIADRPRPPQTMRSGLVFVGRLDESKGIREVLEAWKRTNKGLQLQIVGEGPLHSFVAAAAATEQGVKFVGYLEPAAVRPLMEQAQAVVVASRLYEGFPLVIVEAFAAGTPVIAPRLGAMAEIVDDRRTGLFFEPGNVADLASKFAEAAADPQAFAEMGQAARTEYETKYDGETNYRLLMHAYDRALAVRHARN